jgi:hypothetical protein
MENHHFSEKWNAAQKLFKEFKVVTFGNKKSLMAMIEYVKQDETLLYADFSNIEIQDTQTREVIVFPGTLFVSDQRIFLFQPIPFSKERNIYEYSFEKLRSVSSRGNGLTGGNVTFATDEQKISFIVSYHASVIDRVTAIIDNVIETSCTLQKIAASETGVQIGTVHCGGCGAVFVTAVNTYVVCDYCDRPLVFEEEKASPLSESRSSTPVASVADELMKFKTLLDAGALTQEEFDAKKAELLGL